MYDTTASALIEAGEKGQDKRPPKPTTDEILSGLVGFDPHYSLIVIADLYLTKKAALEFVVGDRVKIKRQYWYLGNQNTGWHGYSQMFADASGVITSTNWNPHLSDWVAEITYEDSYRYSDYKGGMFFISDRPESFNFRLSEIEKV